MQTVPYTTEAGVRIELVPVRETVLLLAAEKATRAFREAGEPIDPPTFQLESVGGDVVTVPHRPPTEDVLDPETGKVLRKGDPGTLDVEDAKQTAYNWAVWRRHQDALMRLQTARMLETMQAYYYFGVKCTIPPDDEWLTEQIAFGLPIEEIIKDPIKRKVHYIVTVLLTPREQVVVQHLLRTMTQGKAVSKEQVSELEDLFRRAAGQLDGAAIDETLAELRALVGPPTADGVKDGESVGPDA